MKMEAEKQSEIKSYSKKKLQQEDLSHLAKGIIANAGVGIYIVQHGKFVYVSDLYQKITGYTDKELIGTYSLGNVHPDDKENVRKHANQCLKHDTCEPYEYRFITRSNEIIWVLETVTSIVYEGERGALGSFMDITERKNAEEATRKGEERYSELVKHASVGIYEVDYETGRFKSVNDIICEYAGYMREELLNMNFYDLFTEESQKAMGERLEKLYAGERLSPTVEYCIRTKSGGKLWILLHARYIYEDGKLKGATGIIHNITERKQAEEARLKSEDKYRAILEDIQEGYFEVDFAGNFTLVNDSTCSLLGYSKEEIMGMNNRQYTDKENAKKLFQAFNKVYSTGESTEGFDWQIKRKDGTKRYVEASVSLQKDSSDKPVGFKGIVRDVTERKQIEQQLNHMATHDVLTGLPNRMLFMDRLQVALAQSKRKKHRLAVMMLDLDHFKDINDTLGHMVGDKLLKEVSYRLKGILRQNDTIARLGGDEFVVLLSDLEKTEYAAGVAKVILKALQKPFLLSDNEITSSASIGIAVYPDDCEDMDSLLKKSDMAMYSVKTHGRNGYKFFSDII